jgi:hypothetical protein
MRIYITQYAILDDCCAKMRILAASLEIVAQKQTRPAKSRAFQGAATTGRIHHR